MKKAKIRYNGKVVELTDCCRWEVRNGVLWNRNTNHDEGVDGDIVEYEINGIKYRGHVDEGPTCYQFVHTGEWGGVCLSAKDALKVTYFHAVPVELVEAADEYPECDPEPEAHD